MLKISIRATLVLAAMTGSTACSQAQSQPIPARRMVTISGGTQCDDWGCGSNTPNVNTYPIRALHLDGMANGEGVHIVSQLYIVSKWRSILFPILSRERHALVHSGSQQYWLDVVGGEFVARDPRHGRVVLKGRDMEKSWFELRLPPTQGYSEERIIKVIIAKVAKVPLFPMDRPGDVPGSTDHYVMAYELALEGPDINPEIRLCSQARAWDASQPYAAPKEDSRGVPILPWDELGKFAVLVKGETYNASTSEVALTGPRAERWFNIACSGMALSKMRLMDHDPEGQKFPTTPMQRQATLKMLTARYCPSRPEQSYTVDGQPVVWQNSARWFRPDEAHVSDEVEAVWNEHGATCLNTPRRQDATDEPKWPRDRVVESCPELEPCGKPVGPWDPWDPLGQPPSRQRRYWAFPEGAVWVTALSTGTMAP